MNKDGIAMWHYRHRSTIENVRFFADSGFDFLSLNQWQVVDCILEADGGELLAKTITEKNLRITVHGGMPRSHNAEDVDEFKKKIILIGEWQKKYGLIEVISFDIFEEIRDNIASYINFVLDEVPICKVAVEDFGLNEKELLQIEYLKDNDRFGYLIDIGHLYIRLTGKSERACSLFRHSVLEGEGTGKTEYKDFVEALKSKTFPIFEIHLHNNDGIEDLHLFLEDGSMDIKCIADALKELKYEGAITIESAPGYKFECAGREADEGIIRTFKHWKVLYRE